jgi:hypothetical protein
MSQQTTDRQKILVQNSAETLQAYKNMCVETKLVCQQHVNQAVRVELLNGQSHEGRIAHVDDRFLYLQITQPNPQVNRGYGYPGYGYPGYPGYPYQPAPYPNYNNFIMPLALFDLLALTLLL